MMSLPFMMGLPQVILFWENIDISKLEQGVYLLKVVSANAEISKKLIVK